MKNTKKKGFTLVELVIVIAVIAILAAVLIPTFSNVIEKANQSKALQAARIDFENYILELDYTKDSDVEASTADYIIVESGYAFIVDNGNLKTTAYKAVTSGTQVGSNNFDFSADYTLTVGSVKEGYSNIYSVSSLTVIDNNN